MELHVGDSSSFSLLSCSTPPSIIFTPGSILGSTPGSYLMFHRGLDFDGDSGIYFAFLFCSFLFFFSGDLVGFNFGLETIPYDRMGLVSLVARHVR